MTRRQIQRRPVSRRLAQLGGALVIHDAVDQGTTVRSNKVIGHSASVKCRSPSSITPTGLQAVYR
jgi:hypothetical protein